MKWDFHGTDPLGSEYIPLIKELYCAGNGTRCLYRMMTLLSFGFRSTRQFVYHLKPHSADTFTTHGNRLNSLCYRGLSPIVVTKRPEYRIEYYCRKCGSTNLYKGSRWNDAYERWDSYYRCKNNKCSSFSREINPLSRRVPTGLFTVYFGPIPKPSKCSIL